jgi:GntR family transcriptional regulator
VSIAIEVDVTGAVPPYEQIRAQVAGHVAAGHLRPGDRLPTVRALAADLGVAAGTVARAYRELEQAGVVQSRRRTGTVVCGGVAPPSTAVAEAAAVLVARAREAGLTEAAVLDLVAGTFRRPTTSNPPARAR